MINELNESEKLSYGWWRWPCLPFASYIGAAIGTFLISVIQWLGMRIQGGFREDGWYFLYILPVISSCVFGWLFVIITLYVAPRGKFLTAVIMVTILGVFAVIGQIYVWSSYPLSQAIQSTIGTIATMVSAIVSLVNYKNDYS